MKTPTTPAAETLEDWCTANARALEACVCLNPAETRANIEDLIVDTLPREIGDRHSWDGLVERMFAFACHVAS